MAAEGERLGGGMLALEAIWFLTKEAEPGGTTLVDACDGFNKIR